MKLKQYQLDAFAEKLFEGNPAAVVPLETWLPDHTMQSIAGENNLAETAFFVKTGDHHHIRWFTPTTEVELCGHATLASAHLLFSIVKIEQKVIVFNSLSGKLTVTRNGDLLTLNFPKGTVTPCDPPDLLVAGLGKAPIECYEGEDYLAVFDKEEDMANLAPDMSLLEKLEHRGVIVTAPSKQYDFVVRFFAPKYGIPEDPVTGSAYTRLAPYWTARLGKSELKARQISTRGGNVHCQQRGDRVLISGRVVKFMEGEIEIAD